MKNKTIKRVLGYYKPYWKMFASDMCFALLGAVITLVIPLITRYITGTVVHREPSTALRQIIALAALMLGLVALEFVCNYFIATVGHNMGARMECDMRSEIFSHYQKLSFSFFDNEKVGQLMSRVTNDLFEISELFHHGPEDVVISLIKFIGTFIILLNINSTLALSMVAVLPFMIAFAFVYNKKLHAAFLRNRRRIADINSQLEDSLSGIRVVKSFSNEDIEQQKFEDGNTAFLESKKASYKVMGAYNSGMGSFTSIITIVVVIVGGVLLTMGTLDVEDMVTFILYIANFTDPIKRLVSFTEQFQNGASGFSRFLEVLAVEPDIEDAKDAVDAGSLKGEIAFKDVAFHYTDTTTNVLQNLNLDIKAGEYVALVGSSGAGKTTLCSLIPRFYDVTNGSVSIDGRDVRSVTQRSLRRNIGIVQQDVYLFAGTVRDNIRYGKPDATDEEIIQAAKNANAHAFIMELPDGYDTDIGQRGVKLSGGQKQRLSLARVFLKNPPILIFDEATSALDNESEKVVQDSLEHLAKNRTTLVIAHRLSTIRNAQRILVLTEEGIAEEGTHDELMAQNGIYAGLYHTGYGTAV